MKTLPFLVCLSLLSFAAAAQVGIGTSTPDASAALDVSSNAKGLLVPHLTAAQRSGISQPATGLLVYQTDGVQGFYYNTGTPAAPNWFNLTNYTLQQNINTNGKWVSPDGANNGLFMGPIGAGIGTATPDGKLTLQGLSSEKLLSLRNASGVSKWHLNLMENSHLNFAETGIENYRLYLKSGGNVGIGTADPTTKLEVAGDIKYSGDLNMGIQYIPDQYSIPGHNWSRYNATCPSGTQVIGGGGGHRDNNSAQTDIVINYSGPNPDNPTRSWRLLMNNTSGSSRTIQVYIICAKVK